MIGQRVHIGFNTQIGHNVVIEDDCYIGDNCFIGHNCVLRQQTSIGDRTRVGHGTVLEGWMNIGSDCLIQSQCNLTKGLVVEDKVFIGQLVVTTNDKRMVHQRRARVPFVLNAPVIRFGARIGAGAILLPGTVVGKETFVGAGAVVTGRCDDFGVYYGNPAKKQGEVPDEERL